MDQTSPPALIAGPPAPLASVQSTETDAGDTVGLHGLEPVLAGHVHHVPDDGIATPGDGPRADGRRGDARTGVAPEVRLVHEIGQLVLADLQRGPVREQCRCGRTEVLVV